MPPCSIRPLLVLALVTLAGLLPAIRGAAGRVPFDASMEVLLSTDERTRGTFEKLETAMTSKPAVMILARIERMFSDEGAQLIADMRAAIISLDGIDRVFSLTSARRPVRAPGLTLDLSKLVTFEPFLPLEETGEEEWARIKAFVTEYPWSRDLLVSADGEWTMLLGEISRPLHTHEQRRALREELDAALAPFERRVGELHMGSLPFVDVEMREAIEANVRYFLYLLPLLLAGILLVTFRSLAVLVCVLLFEAAAIGSILILFDVWGESINIYTGILFPLIAGLELTFLTHFLSAFQWAQRKGYVFGVALHVALTHVLRPSAIAATTTIVGLLALLVCDIELVRTFGLLGAQAVVTSFLITFVPSLLLARWLSGRTQYPEDLQLHANDGVTTWFERLAPLVTGLARRRGLILGLALTFCAAALPAIPGVRTDLRAVEFLSEGSRSRAALTAIDQRMGGMNLFELVIDCGEEDGIQRADSLRYMEQLQLFGLEQDGVTNVYGYAQIYSMLHELMKRGAPGSRAVPEEPAVISMMTGIVHGQDFVFAEALYDEQHRRTTLFFRTAAMPAQEYIALLERIVTYAEDVAPAHVTVQGRAGMHSVMAADQRIVSSQMKSLGACILAVFLTLCALWRSPRLALVAVLASLPPLAAMLVLLGYGGIPLNSVTVMVGAVVLGIAVDDGIHLLSFWADERARFDDPREALRWTMAHKLAPMLCTTAVLVSGLGMFLFSSFPPVSDFGKLSVTSLVVALASTLLVVPPLLLVLFRGR